MNQRVTTGAAWWRWPLMPIASIAAAAIGAIVVATLQDVIIGFADVFIESQDGYSKEGWFHLYVYPLVPSAVFGYLLAGVAFHVAPAAKTTACVVMTAIMGFMLIAFTAFTWSAGVPTQDAIQMTAGSFAATAAAVIALFQSDEEREGIGSDAA